MIWLLLACGLWWTLCGLAGLGEIRFLEVAKDGGPDSRVTGFWIIEVKRLFSVALLRFDPGTREVFHSHAFNAVSWILNRGQLREQHLMGFVEHHKRSWFPILTYRWTFHRVASEGVTWVLTFRGPWADTWYEYDETTETITELTNRRRVLSRRTL